MSANRNVADFASDLSDGDTRSTRFIVTDAADLNPAGPTILEHAGTSKLSTTSTGIDVTGRVEADNAFAAYVEFDPTGAIQGTAFNVSSITDFGVGNFGVNYTNNINSPVPVTGFRSGTQTLTTMINTNSSTTVQVFVRDSSTTLTDPSFVEVLVGGTL